jgi:dethiobiotin synthetase
MRGLFVTGTGTGVGKTIVSAALLASMRAAGEPVRAYKPVLTGLDEPPGEWPPDHELLALAAGMDPEEVAPLRYGPAVSPHLAAQLAGEGIDPAALAACARATAQPDRVETSVRQPTVVVEGVGGLLVPLTDSYTVRDLAVELALPVTIVASPGLGTINHTLLTIESARMVGLEVRAVVLTPWPSRPLAMEASNRETIARLGAAEVVALEQIAGPNIAELACAGDRLPWRNWLTR